MRAGSTNSFAMQNRDKKVSLLIDALLDAGVTATVARTLDPTDWGAVARLAKVNAPSDLTISATIERLEQIECAAQRRSA